MQQYVVPGTDIAYDESLIAESVLPTQVTSFKFRGEESVRSIVKQLAVVARNAAWGVRADGKFFFHPQPDTVLATYREGLNIASLAESRERDNMFNRILLTGGYVYDDRINSSADTHGVYRWRGNYLQPASRELYGERRIRLWVPWIRTPEDSRDFTREFFRIYARPTTRYLAEIVSQTVLPKPWEGSVRLQDRNGDTLVNLPVETIRVEFDHAPRFRLEVGPEDPHVHWPEPPHDERWEIPGAGVAEYGGDFVSLTDFDSGSDVSESSGWTSTLDVTSSDLLSSDWFSSESSDESSVEESSSEIVCPLYDTFTDVNGTALSVHTMDHGPGWTQHAGTFEIQSNRAEHKLGTTDSRAYADAGLADVRITVFATTADNTTGASAPGVLVRATNGDNNWLLRIDRYNDTLRIFERNAAVHTIRASTPFVAGEALIYHMTVIANGPAISLTVMGTTVSYASATFNQTATRHGLISTQNGIVTQVVRYDLFDCCPL